jgi:DNA-binding CsgD family transcriptional regulator
MQIHKDFEVLLKNVSVQSSADSLVNYNPLFLESPFVVLKENTIKLEYAAPYFDGFEDLQYSYRLVPMDDSWSKWTALSEKEFSRLPYGNYRFEVKAKNIYGAVSQPTIFSFQVFTPWYWSRWALVGYAVLGLFVLTLIPLIQRKKHKVEKNILTENKEKELQIKNEEIDKLTNDKLKTELNFKNEQLTSVTMQLMKNNEFIQEVQGKITSSLGKSNAKQDLKRIVNSIDKKLSNNDSWDQFAYHFDQVHGGYLKKLAESNIKLSPREIKLAAFLRMNMSSKEISKLLNITVRGVELARYRLRKKLNLEREQNLVEYLIALDDKP